MKIKYMYETLIILILGLISVNIMKSQEESAKIEISGYIDTYFAIDNSRLPDPVSARSFSYANMKKDNFSLNTAQITTKITYAEFIRSNITFHQGDLHKTAWVSAGTHYPMIQQANIGFNVIDKFWVDAGYFLTHIGGESLLPKDNWLSSHSLVTYFEPFYQSGLRVSYESEKFVGQLHILNGNGIFEDNNLNKTIGLYLNYVPGQFINFSYAGVLGNEEPAGLTGNIHTLHNFVTQLNISEEFILKAQFDLGMKDITNQEKPDELKNGKFMGASLTAHYQFNKKYSSTFRFAYVDNSDNVYNPAVKGMDVSLGAEYKPSENSYIRLEGRMLKFDDKFKLFGIDNSVSAGRNELILNMGLWIN